MISFLYTYIYIYKHTKKLDFKWSAIITNILVNPSINDFFSIYIYIYIQTYEKARFQVECNYYKYSCKSFNQWFLFYIHIYIYIYIVMPIILLTRCRWLQFYLYTYSAVYPRFKTNFIIRFLALQQQNHSISEVLRRYIKISIKINEQFCN